MSDNRNISPYRQNKKGSVHLSITQKILLLLLLIIGLMTTLPILVVLFIGLLPTLTLMIIDIRNINKLIIVGCFNLAGVFVYVFNVMKNYSVDTAVFLFSDIFNMILMLGSAAIGLLIYYQVPMLFVYISKISNQHRVASIDERLEKLQELWGKDVLSK